MSDKHRPREKKAIILCSIFSAAVGIGTAVYGISKMNTLTQETTPITQTTKHEKAEARGKVMSGIALIYAAGLIPLVNKRV